MSVEQLTKTLEVCQLFRMSRRTLRRLTAAGVLPFVRIGWSVRFVPSSMNEILMAREISAGPSHE